MTLQLSGSVDEVLDQITRTAHAHGWRVQPIVVQAAPGSDDATLPLSQAAHAHWACLTTSGADAAQPGWLSVVDAGQATARVTMWLPEEGAAEPRERLEAALEALLPATDCATTQALLRRLKRIEGQVRGLQRMMQDGRDCEAVMTQLSAVMAALKQTAARLVSEHLVECVRDDLAAGGDASQLNQRLLNILF